MKLKLRHQLLLWIYGMSCSFTNWLRSFFPSCLWNRDLGELPAWICSCGERHESVLSATLHMQRCEYFREFP